MIHNIHVHAFTSNAVPDGFLPFGLMHVLRHPVGSRVAHAVLRLLCIFSSRFQRLAAFASIGNLGSQQKVLDRVRGFYPSDTRFVVLALDMDYMGAGSAPQPYLAQLSELARLKAAHPETIVPFVAADPRRPDLLGVVRRHVEELEFGGIKIYPSLGFYPQDEMLIPVLEYAQQNGIPVLSHCSRGGVYHKGEGGRLTDRYADPRNWETVLERFPDLKVCLAHYGGGEEWARHLSDPWLEGDETTWVSVVSSLIEREDRSVWADISSTAAEPRFHGLIKLLVEHEQRGKRILYGSDYYMVQRNVTEREFGVQLRAFLGKALWRKIAEENPAAFLARS